MSVVEHRLGATAGMRVENCGTTIVGHLWGDLDHPWIAPIGRRLSALLACKPERLVIDLAGVTATDPDVGHLLRELDEDARRLGVGLDVVDLPSTAGFDAG